MNKSEESNINKIIIKYSLSTLLVLIVFSLIAAFAITLIVPKQVATFAYNQGWHEVAEHYYIKEYEKNENIDSLYNVVIISATNNSYKNIVNYYEKLLNEPEYSALIKSVNENTEKTILGRPQNIMALSLLLNEENYLGNKYVGALLELGEFNKAFSFAKNNLVNNNVLLKQQNSFLFGGLINSNNLNNLEFRHALTQKEDLQNSTIENISTLFENYFNLINTSNQQLEDDELTLIEFAHLLKAKETFKQIAATITEFNNFYLELNEPHDRVVFNNTQITSMLEQAIGS